MTRARRRGLGCRLGEDVLLEPLGRHLEEEGKKEGSRESERERWSWGLGGMEERDDESPLFPMNDALDLFEREKCSYVLLPPEDQT